MATVGGGVATAHASLTPKRRLEILRAFRADDVVVVSPKKQNSFGGRSTYKIDGRCSGRVVFVPEGKDAFGDNDYLFLTAEGDVAFILDEGAITLDLQPGCSVLPELPERVRRKVHLIVREGARSFPPHYVPMNGFRTRRRTSHR